MEGYRVSDSERKRDGESQRERKIDSQTDKQTGEGDTHTERERK